MNENLIGALIGALIAMPLFGLIVWWNVRYIKMQWRTMHALERIAISLEKLILEKHQ